MLKLLSSIICMLILIGLVIEGSIQVRSVHGAPTQWIVKYATSVKTPADILQEEGEFSFTVPADSPYSNKDLNSTANGKVIYNLKTVYPPIAQFQCTGKYNIQYTSSVSVMIIPVQGNDSTQVVHFYRISGTEPKSAFYTVNCVTDDGRTWQSKAEANLPYVSLCRGSNVIKLPLKDGATFKEDNLGYKCEVTIHGTANQKPIADAGPDQVVMTGNTVILNADGSYDPDGDPITYSWTQISGPSVSLSNPNSPNPTFTAPSSPPPEVTDTPLPFRPASFVMEQQEGLTPVSTPTNPQSAIVTLVFRLIVNDGTLSSLPSTVIITAAPCTAVNRPNTMIRPIPDDYYVVQAPSLAEVKFPKKLKGFQTSGEAALTYVDPKANYKTDSEGRVTCGTVVTVTIQVTMPRWEQKSFEKLSPAAQAEWKRFTDALRWIHENGHVQGAFEAFSGLGNKMMGKTIPEANKILDNTKKDYYTKSLEYDKITNHGESQKAVLNISIR